MSASKITILLHYVQRREKCNLLNTFSQAGRRNRQKSSPPAHKFLCILKKLGFAFSFLSPPSFSSLVIGKNALPMDRLRPRERRSFYGFTTAELEKLEKLFQQFGEQTLNRRFCQRTASAFSRSAGRTGKPVVKANEVQCWFENKHKDCLSNIKLPFTQEAKLAADADACTEREADGSNQDNKAEQVSKGEKIPGLSQLEFEAKSSKDGAWYDVDRFLTHRYIGSGEAEVRVRFVGFSAEDDEWVNVKRCVRERSVPFEHWECNKVKVGDILLCFQERQDQAIYYDAHVIEIQRKMHDIRGCRCIFLVRYNHDNTEEKVRLRRLCRILVPLTRS